MENTGLSLRPKAEKYNQPALRAGKRSFMGKSWELRSTALLSVYLCLGLTDLLCHGLSNCQSISVYGSLTLPGPLELRMILLWFILLENCTFHSLTSICAAPYPASQLFVLLLYFSSYCSFVHSVPCPECLSLVCMKRSVLSLNVTSSFLFIVLFRIQSFHIFFKKWSCIHLFLFTC